MKRLGFDVFGLVMDLRSEVARAAAPFLEKHNVLISPDQFADDWLSLT